MPNILIVGATSAIAQASARLWASEGANFFLVARNEDKLAATATDLDVRGASQIATATADVTDLASTVGVLDQAWTQLETIDIVLVAHGSLPDQAKCETDWRTAQAELTVNFSATAVILGHVAGRLEAQANGSLAVITSVAGDRGRKSNYVYGSAKAGIDTLLEGLRHRLSRKGVQVLTIKPGFVATPMTAHLDHGPLFASPHTIAKGIVKAVRKKRRIVYLPFFWRYIMWVIRRVPARIFYRTNL